MNLKFNLVNQIRDYFQLTPWEDIISWSKHNINFSDDVSSQRNFLDLQLTPHLIEVLQQWQFTGKIKEVTVCGIEQHGKSLTWVVGLLYSMIYKPCQSLVIYPSDDLGMENNLTKLKPLMSHIQSLKRELEKPRSFRSDRYNFSNLTSYFGGSGRKIVSKSCKIRIADQLDQWSSEFKSNFEDLRKRGRSYSESMLWAVCTPTFETGRIWKQFLKSSQGYWTLKCQGCGQHTMRSCDLHNLQFESTYNESLRQHLVTPGTCRLVCPICKTEHTEDEKVIMNLQGKYIHKVPELLQLHPGFQFGVLCSLFPFMTWQRIANKILQSGKKSDLDDLVDFDNSWRGLPYKRREVVKEDFEKLKSNHIWTLPPVKEDIEMVFVTADTQEEKSVVGVFAMDKKDNIYLLRDVEVKHMYLDEDQRAAVNLSLDKPVQTLEDIINQEYLGIKPLFAVVDRQGHRSSEVQYLSKRNSQVIMYQGTRFEQQRWRTANHTSNKLILVAARHYQAKLIHQLYNQKNKEQNFLYFHPEVTDECIKQILAMKPDNTKKFGDVPENWQAQGVHDFFDVVKMAYFAKEYAVETFRSSRFILAQAPSIKRRFENQKKQQQQVMQKKQKNDSFFSL